MFRGHQRPSEAIWGRLNLSFLRIFKSLFEGVPDIRLGLYFVWLALFTSQFSWACFWGQGRVHRIWWKLLHQDLHHNWSLGWLLDHQNPRCLVDLEGKSPVSFVRELCCSLIWLNISAFAMTKLCNCIAYHAKKNVSENPIFLWKVKLK